MKNRLIFRVLLVMACFLMLTPQLAHANDYLEHKEHFTVMNVGNGVYRFYVPIWVYGAWNNYYLNSTNQRTSDSDSYIWYSLKPNQNQGSEEVHRIVTVAAVQEGLNKANDFNEAGEGFIYVHSGGVVIQSMKDGTKLSLAADDDTYWNGWTNSLKLKRKNDDDHKDITYIEFDWYPPQELAGKDFFWGVSAHIYKEDGSSYDTKWWKMEDRLNMSDPQTPELFTPYLYALDEDGTTGYGNAAVQYVTYQQGLSYHTSLDPSEIPVSENSGAIIVPTADTVQHRFNATFRVNLTNDTSNAQIFTLKTNSLNIPAYHRIYDFGAEEVLDAQQSVTGKVKLRWGIHYPGAEDLLEGDVFQVERALSPDFSDAQSITVQNFFSDSASYSYEDDPTDVLLADTSSASGSARRISEEGEFIVQDAEGNPKIKYLARLTSNQVFEPGKAIYYRVRRGSSAVWGWREPFAQKAELKKNNYLAPLAEVQEPYSKDPDYETNRKVHFYIHLANKAVTLQPEAENLCEMKTFIQRINGMIPIRLTLRGTGGIDPSDYQYKLYYLPQEGKMQETMLPLQSGNRIETEVEAGSMVQISVINSQGRSVNTLNLIGKLDDIAAYIAEWELYPGNGMSLNEHIYEDEAAMESAMNQVTVQYPLPDSVRHTLYTKIVQKVSGMNSSNTYRNWDRNAIIYLQRISVESGDTIEFPVPADSVKRQEDGSWVAHMTNVANLSCTHYRYAVRIDQTGSVLKVLDPQELEPVALNGPDLYYNEVADIARFDASQGTDRYGVILTWEPTPGSVDTYELARRETGSTGDYEVIKRTEEFDFRDNTAVPGKIYDYRLMATYTCNDTTTSRTAVTTGSRSPYGMISGRIHYADGTGCPNMEVRLTSEGVNEFTITDATGAYVFDSLLYGTSKEYHITPVSTYAEFRFNNTTATSTSTTLDASNPVAEGIEFDNISSVRFSGRVLYSKSTIPVRDANILLDSSLVYTAGGPLRTNATGNFELQVPKDHPFTIQVVKNGHTFEGEGFVRMNNDSNLVLGKPLDGVRIWDATKVRLAGRVAGGLKQATQPLGFGLSVNNLGDDLQLVFELEGDNISQIVRDEDDLSRDTFLYAVPHTVNEIESGRIDTVGTTRMIYQKKRIIIRPDSLTGEYCADLFPVRYKITQATARGYATLFAEGKTSEVLDLSNAAVQHEGEMYDDKTARWNETFNLTYRSPIDITCTQMRYGLPMPYFGEEFMSRQNVLNEQLQIPLAEKDINGVYQYTFGHPVFPTGNYSFRITAHEDYYYNNDKTSAKYEVVPINGGKMMVYNGLHASEETQTFSGLFPKWEQATQHFFNARNRVDEDGMIDITIPVDYVSFSKTGEQALRLLNVSVESDGRYVEKQVISAYVTGNRTKGRDYMAKLNGGPVLLDILRDPPGAKSYAFLEAGTSFNYSYSFNLKFDFGIKLDWKYGTSKSLFLGSYLAMPLGGVGPVTGSTSEVSISMPVSIPITSGFNWKRGGSYTFTTNERIETANDNWFVGPRGDIYIGTTKNVLLELTDAVKPLDSLTYSTLSAQMIENVGVTGKNSVVAEGYSLAGDKYYLAIGEEMGASSTVDGSFVYSQDYILTVLLPQLLKERNALLVTGDIATVQAIADTKGSEVYWSHVIPNDTTYALTNYEKIIPSGDSVKQWIDIDRVAEYNKTIGLWIDLIRQNEKEKIEVLSGNKAEHVGNYSISNGVKLTHTNSYNATYSDIYWITGIASGSSLTSGLKSIEQLTKNASAELADQLRNYTQLWGDNPARSNNPYDIETQVPAAKTSFSFTPVFDVSWTPSPDQSETNSRTAGFVLEPDEYSYMNLDVYRRREADNRFNEETDKVQSLVDDMPGIGNDYHKGDYLYGSYVYRVNGGATKCPWEGPDESIFYEQGGRPVQLSTGTLKLENPKIDIIDHEVSDIPYDQPAIIHIRLSNETQQTFENYVVFKLVLVDASNPNGAKVLMDGFPLTGDGRNIKLNPGQTIDKTLEVYAGEGYDFESLTLMLASQCDILNFAKASFSVHFQPTSCDVNISSPHDKWVMNTLSPKDSTGWYLPVVIDGYDVNWPNFDHIEFQYKLSKQSDDAWVNLCSFYADSTLYQNASGSKALMGSGRIENIAFYGERDPMEQLYDLRAVSFCRYGTSFLTKSSPVLTGIKDTRPPRVFGEPEPANSILGVGDNLKLRFNEPIAGNYLDEDNNFQITGITNDIGTSAATALHFDGNDAAYTKAKRDLTDKSFTIDMMIRPTVANHRANDMILFETGDGKVTRQLLLTKDNRLRLIKKAGKNFLAKSSKPMEPIMAFQRIVVVSDKQNSRTRFFAGTVDITDNILGGANEPEEEGSSAYFRFGGNYDGDMLETRIWTKALTVEEIAATSNRSLTGYERELLAYYRMDEGKGETVTDHAHGATLYLDGCSWNQQKGYSLRLDGEPVKLNGNLLGRSAAYDETMLFWFKAESNGTLFSAARHEATDSTSATGTLLALENGELALYSGSQSYIVNAPMTNGAWHHLVLTISRTYNHAALFLDGAMLLSVDANLLEGITGAMHLGGNGFKGNIDEFAIFEQALPKSLVETYENIAFSGDEMGLMAYLPFDEQYSNPNGILEQRFTVNDKRTFKDSEGNVLNKIVPLIPDNQPNLADPINAPVTSHGLLNKLYFDWSFNNDELMVNILNRSYEINKQPIYVTVRDVEDLNGNPMASPVSWTAFVDRNSLKWSEREMNVKVEDSFEGEEERTIQIVNHSGKRHTYTIESLPAWLHINKTSGAIDPMGQQTLTLTFNRQTAVGEYSDIIYLTDEEGLAEPLIIGYEVEATPPYEAVEEGLYPFNMSVCAQVMISEPTENGQMINAYDTDDRDIVYALYRNRCVGQANVSVNALSNTTDVYLTVMGNEEMARKELSFQLWQASTGKVFNLTPSEKIVFAQGAVYGCGSPEPVILSTSASEMQTIELAKGWNWISFHLNLQPATAPIVKVLTATEPWMEGDLIKNPATQHFVTYSELQDAFVGDFSYLRFIYTYMVYSGQANTLCVNGNHLPADSMHVTVRGDGNWSALPCLLNVTTPIAEALADYYGDATPGDMIKARNRFAYFSNDKQWVGDLTALRPGEGYFFRRIAPGSVDIRFFDKPNSANAPVAKRSKSASSQFTNPSASTNMTMIATLNAEDNKRDAVALNVYIGDELVGRAEPMDSLYFLTIQSDKTGEIRFETEDGQSLNIQTDDTEVNGPIVYYTPDAHLGSPKAPIVLKTGDNRVYKVIENNHVIIIRNNERYDVTGKKL